MAPTSARRRLSGSRQYDLGLDVGVTVAGTIGDSRNQTPDHSSFGTKKSALETLRKIGKSLVFSQGDTFGHEVVKSLSWDGNPQESAMLQIANEMTAEGKAKMRANTEWVSKVRELIDIGSRYDMYGSLEEMLESLGLGSRNRAQGPKGLKNAGVYGTVTTKKQAHKAPKLQSGKFTASRYVMGMVVGTHAALHAG